MNENFAERFWWLLVWACIVWYMTVTVYVSLRGALDIRRMLDSLEKQRREEPPD
jgi:hypothetical protein